MDLPMNFTNQGSSHALGHGAYSLFRRLAQVTLFSVSDYTLHTFLASKQNASKGPDIYLHIPSLLSPEPLCLPPSLQLLLAILSKTLTSIKQCPRLYQPTYQPTYTAVWASLNLKSEPHMFSMVHIELIR